MKCWIDDCDRDTQIGSNYCEQHVWQSTGPRFEDRGGSGEGDPPPYDGDAGSGEVAESGGSYPGDGESMPG